MAPNRKAFLDMLAYSEIGSQLLKLSDNGYNVLVGSTPSKPLLFSSYADHPRIYNKAMNSTAAGRYQLLKRYYDAYKKLLSLPDFSPASQDAIALQQVREQNALSVIDAGNIETAVCRCANIWASLPGAGYGQHENKMEQLIYKFKEFGGQVA